MENILEEPAKMKIPFPQVQGEGDYTTLQVMDVNTKDGGMYTVVCTNGAGEVSSTCEVSVQSLTVQPFFTTTPQHMNIGDGEPVCVCVCKRLKSS